MALTSPVVFPLHSIDDGKCGCGKPACTRVGKHPAVLWGELKSGDAVPMPAPGAGYGIKTGARPLGSGVIVVDTDGWEATDEWARRCAEAGVDVDTYTVQSGAEGKYHFFFEWPGFPVRIAAGAYWHNGKPKTEGGQGIDIKGDGGFVVGAGSPHKTGATYAVVHDAPIAPAPAFLVEWLRTHMASKPAAAEVQPSTMDVSEPTERARRRELFRAYLEHAPPCIENAGGDEQLWRVVQYGAYDLALPTLDVLDLIREVYDPRCVPPWGDELDERVIHKSNDAKSSSARKRQEPIPLEAEALFASSKPTQAAALAELDAALAPTLEADVDDEPTPAPRAKQQGIFWDDWDAPLEPPVWLVEGLIPVSTVGGFVAHGSSLKTWTALSLGASVATGTPWLGKYATKSGRVIILDYESGEYELRRRVRMLEGGRVVGLGAWSMPDKHVDDVELWKMLAAIPGVVLVIVDSLAAGTSPGVDENDKAAAWPLTLAGRYSEGTGAAVVFIHHSKKDDGGDARKAVRGSTAIYAAMDWCYGFVPIEETQAFKRMQMENIKPCMGARPLPVPLELTDKGLHLFKGEQKLERDAPDHEVQGRITLALQAGPIETKALIAKKLGMRNELVGPHVDALEVRKEIVQVEGFGYVLESQAAPLQRRRVLMAIEETQTQRRPPGTVSKLAKAACVDTSVVEAMLTAGDITHSADGRFLITQRANSNKPVIVSE